MLTPLARSSLAVAKQLCAGRPALQAQLQPLFSTLEASGFLSSHAQAVPAVPPNDASHDMQLDVAEPSPAPTPKETGYENALLEMQARLAALREVRPLLRLPADPFTNICLQQRAAAESAASAAAAAAPASPAAQEQPGAEADPWAAVPGWSSAPADWTPAPLGWPLDAASLVLLPADEALRAHIVHLVP